MHLQDYKRYLFQGQLHLDHLHLYKLHPVQFSLLLAEVLNEMVNTCKVYNCNLLITTFPNVENLSPDSEIRLSLLSFSKFMKNNHSIKIHDGYEPFISNKIKNASYSLTDVHSNCEGYQLYANWLADLK